MRVCVCVLLLLFLFTIYVTTVRKVTPVEMHIEHVQYMSLYVLSSYVNLKYCK